MLRILGFGFKLPPVAKTATLHSPKANSRVPGKPGGKNGVERNNFTGSEIKKKNQFLTFSFWGVKHLFLLPACGRPACPPQAGRSREKERREGLAKGWKREFVGRGVCGAGLGKTNATKGFPTNSGRGIGKKIINFGGSKFKMSQIFDKFKLKYEELEEKIYSPRSPSGKLIPRRKRRHHRSNQIPPEIMLHIQLDKELARLYLKYFRDED